MRSAGIRLLYPELNPLPEGVKAGILLETGFDQVVPNQPCLISSWAYETASSSGLPGLTDNRAIDVAYYEPGYTRRKAPDDLDQISSASRNWRDAAELFASLL